MYRGIGQTADAPPCSSLNIPAGTYGPFNCTGNQSDAYAAASPVAAPSATGSCDMGYTYSPSLGVCVQSNAMLAWLGTGNNAIYAGAGVLGLLLLLMMGKR